MISQLVPSRIPMGGIRSAFLLLLSLCLVPSVGQAQASSWLVKPQYDEIVPVSPSLLKVSKNGQYGLINMKGEEVVNCSYHTISDFVEDVCLIIDSGNRLLGIVNSSGTVTKISRPYFVDSSFSSFSEGLLNVKDSNGKSGYIKKDGTEFCRFDYNTTFPFAYGYAVVRKGNFYFPVDRNMKISNAFMNTDYAFMSTFGAYKNTQCAVVLNRNKIYIVDIYGSILDSYGDYVSIDKRKRFITATRATFQFDEKWRLVQVGKPGGGVVSRFDQPDNEYFHYKVNNRTYDFPKSSNGLYSIVLDGKEIIAPQFVDVSNLSGNSVIASTSSGYGILYINNATSQYTKINSRNNIVFNHYVSVPVSFEVKDMSGSDVEIKGGDIQCSSGTIESKSIDRGIVGLQYLPDNLNRENGRVEFSYEPVIEGLIYARQKFEVTYSYENAFVVSVPSKVMLTYDDKAAFDIVVRNSADSKSAKCSIYVNDALWCGNVIIDAQSSYRIPYTCTVQLGDMDQMQLGVSVKIMEESCPSFSIRKNVECLRKFENN